MSGFGLACDVMHSTIDDIGLSEISQIAHTATDAAVEHKDVALHLKSRIFAQVGILNLVTFIDGDIIGAAIDILRNLILSERIVDCYTFIDCP